MSGLALIAALDKNHVIGTGGRLPWRLPADLRRFKALTLGKPVLMGWRTAGSIGRALPGRRNLVLSRRRDAPYDGQETLRSLEEALHAAGPDSDVMVIGGGEIYRLTLPLATRLHLTWVDTKTTGAGEITYFPDLAPAEWTETVRESRAADETHAHAFEFVDYTRVGIVG